MARRKKPRATTALVVADDPERNRLRALKAQLGQRRDEIAELDLEIETLRAELSNFEAAYQAHVALESHALKRVERLLIHFERWTELLREVSPAVVPLQAERLDARRDRELTEPPFTPPSPPSAPEETEEAEAPRAAPAARLKAAYRALARRFHPDLARTEQERVQLSERMARINAVYRDGDVDRLEVMAEQAKGGDVDDNEADIGEQLTLLEERLAWFDVVLANLKAERAALELTPSCALFRQVEQAKRTRGSSGAKRAKGDRRTPGAHADPFEEIQRGLRSRIEKSYSLVRLAAHQLESEVKRFNSRDSALTRRQAEALERSFDPFADKRVMRLGLEELKNLAVQPAARQLADRLEREGLERPAVLRLLLFTYIAELSRFPLPGLERFDDISLRLSTLARPQELHASLERALVDADLWVEFGVRQATEQVAHLGLRFRGELIREALPVLLTSLPIRRELRRVLGVVGEREACPACATQVFAVPLFRTHGLDDFRSLVCPRCGATLKSYWMPKGQDVQAVLNDAFLDFELVTEWSFRLGRGSFGVQLLPLQVDALSVGQLKRRVYDDVFRRYQLEVELEQVELVQDGAVVGDDEPLNQRTSTSFVVRLTEGAALRADEALEVLLHRVRNRFRSGS